MARITKNSIKIHLAMVVEKYQCRDSVTISVDAVVYYQVNSRSHTWPHIYGSETIKPAEIAPFNDNSEFCRMVQVLFNRSTTDKISAH